MSKFWYPGTPYTKYPHGRQIAAVGLLKGDHIARLIRRPGR